MVMTIARRRHSIRGDQRLGGREAQEPAEGAADAMVSPGWGVKKGLISNLVNFLLNRKPSLVVP